MDNRLTVWGFVLLIITQIVFFLFFVFDIKKSDMTTYKVNGHTSFISRKYFGKPIEKNIPTEETLFGRVLIPKSK